MVDEIAAATAAAELSHGTCHKILSDDLNISRVTQHSVPRILTQVQCDTAHAQELLKMTGVAHTRKLQDMLALVPQQYCTTSTINWGYGKLHHHGSCSLCQKSRCRSTWQQPMFILNSMQTKLTHFWTE
jgi:hypothetical protein